MDTLEEMAQSHLQRPKVQNALDAIAGWHRQRYLALGEEHIVSTMVRNVRISFGKEGVSPELQMCFQDLCKTGKMYQVIRDQAHSFQHYFLEMEGLKDYLHGERATEAERKYAHDIGSAYLKLSAFVEQCGKNLDKTLPASDAVEFAFLQTFPAFGTFDAFEDDYARAAKSVERIWVERGTHDDFKGAEGQEKFELITGLANHMLAAFRKVFYAPLYHQQSSRAN